MAEPVGQRAFEDGQTVRLDDEPEALVQRPRLLLHDEPTTGVDPVTRQDFWQLIIRLLSEGVAVVVSTPYMDEAARCNRLGFMIRGRILMSGTPRQMSGLLAGRVVMLVAQPKSLAREVCHADPNIEDVAAFGDRLHLRLAAGTPTEGPDNALERLRASLIAAGAQVSELRLIQPSLEDVFIALQQGVALAASTTDAIEASPDSAQAVKSAVAAADNPSPEVQNG